MQTLSQGGEVNQEKEKILDWLSGLNLQSLDKLRNKTYQDQYYTDREYHLATDRKLELKIILNETKYNKRRYFIKELEYSPNKTEQLLKSDPDIHKAKTDLLKQERLLNKIQKERDRITTTIKIVDNYYWKARD